MNSRNSKCDNFVDDASILVSSMILISSYITNTCDVTDCNQFELIKKGLLLFIFSPSILVNYL